MDIGQWEFAYVPTTGVRRAHETPIVLATDESLEGFGCLVEAATGAGDRLRERALIWRAAPMRRPPTRDPRGRPA
jgi:hypothetical protein